MKKLVLFAGILLATLAGRNVFGQIDPGQLNGREDKTNMISAAVPFLTIAPDARSAGMGDVGAATRPDANATHWNASKLAFMDNNYGLSVSFTPWLKSLGIEDMYIGYLSGFAKFSENQAVYGSLKYFTLGNVVFRTSAQDQGFSFTPNEFALSLGYVQKLGGKVSGSVGFKYIYSNLTGSYAEGAKAGNAFAADLGIYYQDEGTIANTDMFYGLGLNISNLGNKISYTENKKDFLPANLRLGGLIGANIDEYNEISLAIDINKLLVPTPETTVDEQGKITTDNKDDLSVVSGVFNSLWEAPGGFSEKMNELTYSFGVEYWYSRIFALRFGYFNEHKDKGNRKYFSVGGGLTYNVLTLDVAYLIPTAGKNNPLANTVRFSLSFNFK
ncbi:MAG: type IX secretion system outer membrane channel protein PorV [Bacteroidales bacterium]|jgi:hypothetical protein|nr:type IX secretion system outer membrane channel protein PorV [Bacteroidales bacterium]